jgi:hypothetical protein
VVIGGIPLFGESGGGGEGREKGWELGSPEMGDVRQKVGPSGPGI